MQESLHSFLVFFRRKRTHQWIISIDQKEQSIWLLPCCFISVANVTELNNLIPRVSNPLSLSFAHSRYRAFSSDDVADAVGSWSDAYMDLCTVVVCTVRRMRAFSFTCACVVCSPVWEDHVTFLLPIFWSFGGPRVVTVDWGSELRSLQVTLRIER